MLNIIACNCYGCVRNQGFVCQIFRHVVDFHFFLAVAVDIIAMRVLSFVIRSAVAHHGVEIDVALQLFIFIERALIKLID